MRTDADRWRRLEQRLMTGEWPTTPSLEPIDHAEDGRPVYKRSEVVADAKRLAAGGDTDVLALLRTP